MPTTKSCPHCADNLPTAANACRYCGYLFAAPFGMLGANSSLKWLARGVGILGLFWLLYVIALAAG